MPPWCTRVPVNPCPVLRATATSSRETGRQRLSIPSVVTRHRDEGPTTHSSGGIMSTEYAILIHAPEDGTPAMRPDLPGLATIIDEVFAGDGCTYEIRPTVDHGGTGDATDPEAAVASTAGAGA